MLAADLVSMGLMVEEVGMVEVGARASRLLDEEEGSGVARTRAKRKRGRREVGRMIGVVCLFGWRLVFVELGCLGLM